MPKRPKLEFLPPPASRADVLRAFFEGGVLPRLMGGGDAEAAAVVEVPERHARRMPRRLFEGDT